MYKTYSYRYIYCSRADKRHEICCEPSTERRSGQPQCSAHRQWLRKYCPRFRCWSILQCSWSLFKMNDDKARSLAHTLYNLGMSRVCYFPQQSQHRTMSTRHHLALCRMWSTGCWVSADESQFWKFLSSPTGGRTEDLRHSRLAFYH